MTKRGKKQFATLVRNLGSEEAAREFMSKRGAKGGSIKGAPKGFAARPELASSMGRKGGQVSKRK